METNQNTPFIFDYNELVEGLKKEDTRNLKMTHNFKNLLWILTPIYLLLFVINLLIEKDSLEAIGVLLYGLGFFLFAFIFNDLNKIYKSVDYGVPTTEMLRKAAQRYKLWQKSSYLILGPVLLFCCGFGFSFEKWMPGTEIISRYFIAFTLILIIFTISFFVGYLIWRKRQKPLRDKALSLLAEIEK